jgi:hypothetical protein
MTGLPGGVGVNDGSGMGVEGLSAWVHWCLLGDGDRPVTGALLPEVLLEGCGSAEPFCSLYTWLLILL